MDSTRQDEPVKGGEHMKKPECAYEVLMAIDSLESLDADEAINKLGLLINLSPSHGKKEGLQRAVSWGDELAKRSLTSSQRAILHYDLANAWEDLRRILGKHKQLDWKQEELEKGVEHLRRSITEEGFSLLSDDMRCRAFTNLANALDHVGRFVEAIEYWDRALSVISDFPMAVGNRGICLAHYGRKLYDTGHAVLFLKHAHSALSASLTSPLQKDAREAFKAELNTIESLLKEEVLQRPFDMHSFPLGSSASEVRYRKWCLNQRLFLNPLNDLGSFSIAARDVFSTPSIVTRIGEGPCCQGFFNQMKQEYVSARYMYFAGISARSPHFSDRDVMLYDTLDYPTYCLAAEKVKLAFRSAYSIFDKIAFFLNHYLNLSIRAKSVYFRTFWYDSQKKTQGLKSEFGNRANHPLRGLFWLSKDLYEDKAGFREAMEPDAKDLADVRNHLEHKYLKLHEMWASHDDPGCSGLSQDDTLAHSLSRRDFEAKTLRLLKMARSALIYLSLAIRLEEQGRAKKRDSLEIVPPISVPQVDDKWKR